MKVLLAITKGEVGGAQEHVRILARGLAGAGHEVTLVVSKPSALADWAEGVVRVHPWPSITGPLSPWADLRARRELGQAVERWRPDVVHLHSSKAGVVGTGLLRPPDGVTVFTCHHAAFGPGRPFRHRVVARPVEQVALRRVDGIISVGWRDVPALQRMAGPVPVVVIRNAVPAGPAPPPRENPSPVGLWVARLAPPKDPLLAVRAWEHVVRRHGAARLLMCGTGPLEAEVRRAAERHAAPGSVSALGYVADLSPLYAEASVFVLTTRVEGGISMATLEAMTHGLVPVVTDAGDAARLDDREDPCGVFVRQSTPEAVGGAVADLLADAERWRRLRANALRYARHDRGPDDMVAETIAFYERVRAAPGRR